MLKILLSAYMYNSYVYRDLSIFFHLERGEVVVEGGMNTKPSSVHD